MNRFVASVAVSGVLLVGTAASAQTPESRPERPYRGIYASGTDQSQQVLTVNGSVGAGYDTDATRAASEAAFGGIGYGTGQGSVYDQFTGGLSYAANLDKFSAGASLSGSARQYPQLDISTTLSNAASGGASLTLGKNTRLNGGGSATYQSMRGFAPFAQLGDPLLGQIAAPSFDYGSGNTSYYTYRGDVGLTQQLSKRSTLTAGYDRQTNQFSTGVEGLFQQTGSVRFTRSLTRYLGLRLGYGYTEARYGLTLGPRNYQNHNLDTGVDYSRDLSLTRRTRLSFTSGATALRQFEITRYDVIGSARLTREIGRSWNFALAYQRNVGFIETVLAPTFYDAVNAGFNGLFSRRLSFTSNAGVTRGTIGVVSVPGNGFGAVTAGSGLRFALTRTLALNANYTFYHYNFESIAALTTRLSPQTNRHSVSVSLSAWAPIFQHGRKKNATR